MTTERTRPPSLADVAQETAEWAAWRDVADVAKIAGYARERLADPDVTAGNAGRPMDHYRIQVHRRTESRTRPANIRVMISHPKTPVWFTGSADVPARCRFCEAPTLAAANDGRPICDECWDAGLDGFRAESGL